MITTKTVLDLFGVPPDAPELAAAQARTLVNRLTLLHANLAINATGITFAYFHVAPDALTIGPLSFLLLVSATRIVFLFRRSDAKLDPRTLHRRLVAINWCGLAISFSFALWGIALAQYGDTSLKLYVLFFNTTSIIASVFCLAHLRSAALTVALSAVPVVVYFGLSGDVHIMATAANLAAVMGVMVFMLFAYYRDFEELVTRRAELERLSEENAQLANRDMLTGLPNRRSFFTSLDAKIAEATPLKTGFTVGRIDLDGFKPVNDSYGHHAGDAVLREVGVRLQGLVDGHGWVARLGGDEFGLVLDAAVDDARTTELGRAICDALRAPYVLANGTAQIDASIGFAGFPEAGPDAVLLCERADFALHHAKTHARGRPVMFTRAHETFLRSRGVMEQTLRHADLDAEFELVYQPIIDTGLARVTAFEALARWTSPRLGSVSPAEFILVAEQSGLVHGLTRVLLAKALAASAAWPSDIQLSFNLSTFDIASVEAVTHLTDIIATSGVAPARIVFEVTETALMRDFPQAQQGLAVLKDLGVAIALDDFGTGYSSLSYVHRLPIDKLKVDRSFTNEIEVDRGCRDIIQSIVLLCRNLQIECVVEGVETLDQMLMLRNLGCRTMQGYLLQKPLPSEQVAAFLSTGTTVGTILARDLSRRKPELLREAC